MSDTILYIERAEEKLHEVQEEIKYLRGVLKKAENSLSLNERNQAEDSLFSLEEEELWLHDTIRFAEAELAEDVALEVHKRSSNIVDQLLQGSPWTSAPIELDCYA